MRTLKTQLVPSSLAPGHMPNWRPAALENLEFAPIGDNWTISGIGPLPSDLNRFTSINLSVSGFTGPNAIDLVAGAIEGRFYCLNGSVSCVLPVMQMVHFGISILPRSFKQKAQLASKFVVEYTNETFFG